MAEVKKKTVTPSASDTAYKAALDKREADRLARISAYQTTGQVQAKPTADLGIINPATGKEYSPVQQGVIQKQQEQGVKFKPPVSDSYQQAGQQLVEDAKAETAKKTGDTHDASGKLLATQEDIENLGAKMEETILGYGKEIGEALYQQLQTFSQGFGQYSDRLQELMGVNLQQGQMFDTSNEVARKELEEAFRGNGEPMSVIQKYSVSPEEYQQRQVERQELKGLASTAKNRGNKQADAVMESYNKGEITAQEANDSLRADPNVPYHENKRNLTESEPLEYKGMDNDQIVEVATSKIGQKNMMELYNAVISSDMENMSTFDVLNQILVQDLMGIGAMNAKAESFFSAQEYKAIQYYKEAKELAQRDLSEIDAAVEGKDFTPTTIQGLYAKIAKQSQEMQLEDIEAEKKYLKEQYSIYNDIETDKRSRLEGYLKAKLIAMGAGDSSAGLQVMAMTVHNADLRLQMAESNYQLGLSRLNSEGRKAMLNFTNRVTELVLDTENKENAAKTTLNTKLDEIDANRFLNQKEKDKLIMSAFNSYNKSVVEAKQKQKEQEWAEMVFSYNRIQDKISEAFELTKETGVVHRVLDDGTIVVTDMETLDSKELTATIADEKERREIERLKLKEPEKEDVPPSAYTPSVTSKAGITAGIVDGKFVITEPEGTLLQCGAGVNRTLGMEAGDPNGLGDTFTEKMEWIENNNGFIVDKNTSFSSIKPGMVFVFDTNQPFGHTGFVSTTPDENGDFWTQEWNKEGSNEGSGVSSVKRNVRDMSGFAVPTASRAITPDRYDMDILTARVGKSIYGTRISDKEGERVERFIKEGMAQGKGEYEIIDDVLGFKVENNKDFAEKLKSYMLANTGEEGLSGYDMLGLARLINTDNLSGAVNNMEKSIFINQGATDAISREDAAIYSKQAGDRVMSDIVDNLNELGIVAGNWNQLKGKFVATENFQSIESQLTALTDTWRQQAAGANITEAEMRFLSTIMADVKDNPFNALQKIMTFQDMNLNKVNSLRKTFTLPELNYQTLMYPEQRVSLYRDANSWYDSDWSASEAKESIYNEFDLN